MNKSQAVMNIRSNKMMAAFYRGNENYRGASELCQEIQTLMEVHNLTDEKVGQWDSIMLEYQRLADQRADVYEDGNVDEVHAANRMLQQYAMEHGFKPSDYDWWKKNMQRTPQAKSEKRPVNQYSGSGHVSRAVDQAMDSLNLRFGGRDAQF